MSFAKGKLEPKYLTIKYFKEHRNWDIAWMSKKLEVSRAGYYKWLKRDKSDIELENEQLASWITEYDIKFQHILGYRRMRNWINRDKGTTFSKRRVHRVMKLLNIKSQIRRKSPIYRGGTKQARTQNLLRREFEATKPNQKWATDVTEFKVPHSNKKIYLSAIIDLYDKTVVSYVLSNRNDNRLVLNTIDSALHSNPTATPLFHSDRGAQYTSYIFKKTLENHSWTHSMSRVGCCIDNGPVEGFWGILKSEMYYIRDFENEETLRKAIERYIHFYNYERYQERFNNLTPMEVRLAALSATTPIQYPIPKNKRILKYKAMLKEKQTQAV